MHLGSGNAHTAAATEIAAGSTPAPAAPLLLHRAATSLSLAWTPPPGGARVVAYSLEVAGGGSSVYSGADTAYDVFDLAPATCYRYTVRALTAGGWSAPSPVLAASTLSGSSGGGGGDMAALAGELAAMRAAMLSAALAEVSLNPCRLTGFANPGYVAGTVDAVSYRGATDRTTSLAGATSTANCDLAQCAPRLDDTRPYGPQLSDSLRVAVGDGWQRGDGAPVTFVSRTLLLPAGSSTLSFADPTNAGSRTAIPLLGCRAAVLGSGGGGNPATRGCIQLNCTATLAQYLFCGASGGGSSVSGSSALRSALSGISGPDAASWAAGINAASHGVPLPSRYEVLLKVGLTPAVVDDARRARARGVLESSAWREGWVLSFVSALVRSGAAPGFATLLDTFVCTTLPPKFTSPPGGGAAPGVLPATVPGAAAVAAGAAVALDAAGGGSAASFSWAVLVTDTVQTDLARLLASYREAVLPPTFLRGLLAQLVYNLGVARHAFGLHHNGLLTLSAVRLVQVPRGSPAYRPLVCYRTTPAVLYGTPLRVPRAAGGGGREYVSARSGGGDPDFLFDAAADDAAGDACAAAPASSSGSGGSGGGERTSWCLPLADTDGFTIKLHDYGAASLSRKQLEWWTAGHAFPNTAWRDDLRDLAIALCAPARERTLGFDTFAGGALAALCNDMAAGRYATNPLLALRHALFDDLPTLDATPPADRRLHVYAPATMTRVPPQPDARSSPPPPSPHLPPSGAAAAGAPPSPLPLAHELVQRLRPPRPILLRKDAASITVGWAPAATLGVLPPSSSRPAFNLAVNGVSVYSGHGTEFQFDAPPAKLAACLRITVTAFYDRLGLTPPSDPLVLNDCA